MCGLPVSCGCGGIDRTEVTAHNAKMTEDFAMIHILRRLISPFANAKTVPEGAVD